MNILIFVKSNSKLHFLGPLSRYVRTLIINISSSKVPTNKVHIHSVRNVCKLDIIFHLSWQDLSRNVDHPFKNPTQRVRVQTNGAELKYSIHLAHAQTKCPYAVPYAICFPFATNLVPRASFPLTSGRKTRALGPQRSNECACLSRARAWLKHAHSFDRCGSSGSNHYERTKEITEFWLSGSLRICIYGACLKWLLPELAFSDRWSRGTKLWERDWFATIPVSWKTSAHAWQFSEW